MLFLEGHARLLLVVHAIAAGVLVGASTHHALVCRHYLAGRVGLPRLERLYAAVAPIAFVITFGLGAVLYPTYKVRVRAQYFDVPESVQRVAEARADEARRIAVPPPPSPRGPEAGSDLAWVGRLFDIKEHWVALGLAASFALFVLSRRAHPSVDARYAALYFGLALFVCSAAWLGLVVGLVTASYRSVGAAM